MQIAVSIELLLFFHSPDFCEFGIKIYNKYKYFFSFSYE